MKWEFFAFESQNPFYIIFTLKGQIVSEYISLPTKKKLQVSALAPKEWSNQKIKALSYKDNSGLFDLIKCLYFFDLATL